MTCKGICLRTRQAKAPRGRFSYEYGGRYCSTCEAAYLTDQKFCGCCGFALRYTRSCSNYVPKIKPKRVYIPKIKVKKEKDPEAQKLYHRNWYRKNADTVRAKSKQWYYSHLEYERARAKTYYHNNVESKTRYFKNYYWARKRLELKTKQ